MANHERIEAAGMRKEEGNVLFKNGKYQRAAKKYDKAVDYVNEDGLFGDDDQKLVKSLRVSCWLNCAACSLKLNDYQEAIKLCSKLRRLHHLMRFLIIVKRWVYHLQIKYVCLLKRYFQKLSKSFKARVSQEIGGNQDEKSQLADMRRKFEEDHERKKAELKAMRKDIDN